MEGPLTNLRTRSRSSLKDLVTSDIEGSTISFCVVATNIVTAKNIGPISGTPVVSVKIGDHNYYGLCDLGSSVDVARVISFSPLVDYPKWKV